MFNIKRSLWMLQLRYDFQRNDLQKNILMAFALIAVGAGIMFSIGNVNAEKITFLFVLTALYAASKIYFGWTKDAAELSRFLSVPATEAEKWFAEWINSLLIVPFLVAIPIVVAATFNTLVGAGNPIDWSSLWKGLGTAYQRYLMLHPVLFFSAIYFRKAVVLKMLSCLMLLGILTVATVLAIVGDTLMHSGGHGLASHAWIPCLPGNGCLWIYTLFFWGMSYLRLRELEVA